MARPKGSTNKVKTEEVSVPFPITVTDTVKEVSVPTDTNEDHLLIERRLAKSKK